MEGKFEGRRQRGRMELKCMDDLVSALGCSVVEMLLVSLVGKVPVYRAGGSGSVPGRTNTQSLKIIEEKVLRLL